MIPAPFDYTRVETLDEALGLVAGGDPAIRVLAGGQSIIPLMKLRLARPEMLVDVGRIAELRGVRDRPDGGLAIGALTTWAALLDDARIRGYSLLADAIPMIGDVQVRNRGTIGGSLAHADPASDIAAPILALEAELVARSRDRGERSIAAADFFVGPFATALTPDEILTEVRLPAGLPNAGSAYRALPSPASGYPIAGVAVALVGAAASGVFERCVVAVTGVGEQPYRAMNVERSVHDGTAFRTAVETLTQDQRVASDIHADREYRAAMAIVMATRAFDAAEARLA